MGGELSADRKRQIEIRYLAADNVSGIVFDSISLITFVYVGYKTIKNPQKHLVILCSCFGTAALANAVLEAIFLANNF